MKNEMPLHVAARASVVNRTHRVVRERATVMAARRSRVRSLWIPIAVSSALLVIICTAVWSVLNQYDLNPNGIPDASNQLVRHTRRAAPRIVSLAIVVAARLVRHGESAAGVDR